MEQSPMPWSLICPKMSHQIISINVRARQTGTCESTVACSVSLASSILLFFTVDPPPHIRRNFTRLPTYSSACHINEHYQRTEDTQSNITDVCKCLSHVTLPLTRSNIISHSNKCSAQWWWETNQIWQKQLIKKKFSPNTFGS